MGRRPDRWPHRGRRRDSLASTTRYRARHPEIDRRFPSRGMLEEWSMGRLNLKYLLILIPVAIGLSWSRANPILVFLASALAIVPLAGLMGDATEALARFLGPTIGGLLNASLANAPEIIISGFALHAGLVNMVKSSLTGSIIGNLLL